ncbi:hypothetical protein C8R44DRAFT_760998 [Mycena epipterygia]|nr:hypothetical protein C8R44DRAFT_760998 [Mycena epipterygia]
MFGFYLHILRTHGIAQHHFLAASTISLFILGTAHCALQLATTTFHVRILIEDGEAFKPLVNSTNNLEVYSSLTYATSAVYVTSNVIADSIFIFRCYAIWGSRRKIVIIPIFLTLAVAVLGYCNLILDLFSPITFSPFGPPAQKVSLLFIESVATSVFTTVVLMGLTVGRIWWLARAARHTMGRKVADSYYTVCAMILESGALYCIGGIAYLVVAWGNPGMSVYIQSSGTAAITSGAVLGQLVGIAPTIIAVRVGLGYSVENVGSFIVAAPRTRPSPHVISGTPSVDSLDDHILHIHADGALKIEGV